MPVVGDRDDDGIYLFVVQEFLVAPRRLDRISGDLLCQFMTSVVKIASSHAFHTGQLNGGCQQSRSLHADTNNSEANFVTGGTHARQCPQRIGVDHDVFGGQRSSCYSCASLQKSTARKTGFTHTAISSVVIENFLFRRDK
jgi:hypothetical protein